MDWRRSILSGLIYFALVFALGFAMGVARVLVMAPFLGERWAVLLELPVMVAGCVGAAMIAVRATGLRPSGRWAERAVMGALAVGLLLALELTLVRWLRGMTLREALLGGDWVATLAYRTSLLLMGAIPVLLGAGVAETPGRGRIG
jgi:hypothetical protein